MTANQADIALPHLIDARQHATPPSLDIYFGENERALWPLLYKHGALLFRGFDVFDHPAFAQAAERIASPLMDYRGGVANRSEVGGSIYNSTYLASDRALAAHNEKSYSASHPDVILFACMTPAATGGETPLADGRRVWRRLSEPLKDKLRRTPITYIQNLPAADGGPKSWMTAYQSHDRTAVEGLLRASGAKFCWRTDGALHVEETVPPVKRHPATGEEALFCPADRWYCDISAFGAGEKAVTRAAQDLYHYCHFDNGEEVTSAIANELSRAIEAELRSFVWRRGDVLLVDNRIILHGRAPYTGERLVLVAMGTDSQSRA